MAEEADEFSTNFGAEMKPNLTTKNDSLSFRHKITLNTIVMPLKINQSNF